MNYDQALAQAEHVLDLDPDYYDTYLLLGATYASLGRNEEAIAAVERGIELHPLSLKGNRYLGVLYRKVGEYEKSLTAFERSIEISPEEAETNFVYLQRGIVRWMQGEFDEAREDFESAVRINPRYVYNGMYYYLSLHMAGQAETAQAFIAGMADRNEEQACIGAIIRYYAGEASEAEVWRAAAHEDSVEAKANRCEAFFYLGMDHLLGMASGRTAELSAAKARRYFESCLNTGCDVLIEYDLAAWQLHRLDTPQ
jgi:tetratricopeptide (TPR) repeat protein